MAMFFILLGDSEGPKVSNAEWIKLFILSPFTDQYICLVAKNNLRSLKNN
jgi:hypothetical protein